METEVKKELDQLGKLVASFIETNDERLDALAKGESVSAIEEKLRKIEKDLDKAEDTKRDRDAEYKAMEERVNELEALFEGGTGGYSSSKAIHEEHREAFYEMLRQGGRSSASEKCLQAQEKMIQSLSQEKRIDITQGGPSGGFLLPEIIRAEIERMEQKMSPVRQLIDPVVITSNDFKQNVDILGTGSGWVGETDSRDITGTPQVRQRAPTMGELYARPEATQWASMDLNNVDGWLSRSVAEEFTKQEGIAVISGNGTNKPTGFLNTTPVSTPDGASPLRNADALQYIDKTADLTEDVINLTYALQSGYRQGARFAMNSNTVSALRRAKASDGHYLWQPSLQVGEPPTIAGYGFAVWEQMSDLDGSSPQPNNFPIAFGAWNRGYLLVERSMVRVIRDEVTNPGFIRWYFFRREGGIILNNDAIKVLRR